MSEGGAHTLFPMRDTATANLDRRSVNLATLFVFVLNHGTLAVRYYVFEWMRYGVGDRGVHIECDKRGDDCRGDHFDC